MKNNLVVVGWIGTKKAYLNIKKDDAIKRYLKSNPEDEEQIERKNFVSEFWFDDEFEVYDAWEKYIDA